MYSSQLRSTHEYEGKKAILSTFEPGQFFGAAAITAALDCAGRAMNTFQVVGREVDLRHVPIAVHGDSKSITQVRMSPPLIFDPIITS